MRMTRRHLLLVLGTTTLGPKLVLSGETIPTTRVILDAQRINLADQVGRLLGRWCSIEFPAGMLFEWGDASSCELIIDDSTLVRCEADSMAPPPSPAQQSRGGEGTFHFLCPTMPMKSPDVIRLYLSNGKRSWVAPDTIPAWLGDDGTLRLGPIGSHLIFAYQLAGNTLNLSLGRRRFAGKTTSRFEIILERNPRPLDVGLDSG